MSNTRTDKEYHPPVKYPSLEVSECLKKRCLSPFPIEIYWVVQIFMFNVKVYLQAPIELDAVTNYHIFWSIFHLIFIHVVGILKKRKHCVIALINIGRLKVFAT